MVSQRLKIMNNKENFPLHSLWARVSMGFQKSFGRGQNRMEVKSERVGRRSKEGRKSAKLANHGSAQD